MKIPNRLYHATSEHHMNAIETEDRIGPSTDGYVHLAAKIDITIGLAIAKGYERIVVFKTDPTT